MNATRLAYNMYRMLPASSALRRRASRCGYRLEAPDNGSKIAMDVLGAWRDDGKHDSGVAGTDLEALRWQAIVLVPFSIPGSGGSKFLQSYQTSCVVMYPLRSERLLP